MIILCGSMSDMLHDVLKNLKSPKVYFCSDNCHNSSIPPFAAPMHTPCSSIFYLYHREGCQCLFKRLFNEVNEWYMLMLWFRWIKVQFCEILCVRMWGSLRLSLSFRYCLKHAVSLEAFFNWYRNWDCLEDCFVVFPHEPKFETSKNTMIQENKRAGSYSHSLAPPTMFGLCFCVFGTT